MFILTTNCNKKCCLGLKTSTHFYINESSLQSLVKPLSLPDSYSPQLELRPVPSAVQMVTVHRRFMSHDTATVYEPAR